VHGSFFGLLRESAWAAANPFSVVTRYTAPVGDAYSGSGASSFLVKPQDELGQIGGSAGGPLAGKLAPRRLRGKVQLFGSLEAQLRSNPVVSSPAVPTFFMLTSEQIALLGTRGISSAQTSAALLYLDSLMGTVARSSQRLLSFARADVEPGAHDRITAAWIGNQFHSPAGSGFASNSDAVMARSVDSVGDASLSVQAGTLAWQHAFGRRWMNDVRGQFARDLEHEEPRTPLAIEPDIAPGGYAPQVTIGPEGFAYGTPANLGRTAYPDEQRVEIVELLRASLGHHLLSLGGDWSRVHDLLASETNTDGSFSYDSGVVGGYDGGLVDWITDETLNAHAYPNAGCPDGASTPSVAHYFCFRSFTQTFGSTRTEFATHEIAGFVEDKWRVRPGLLLSVGARGEYTLLPLPQAQNVALDAALLSVLSPSEPRLGTTAALPEDRNNFGPRVGVLWSTRLLSLRAGYGVFFGRLPGAMLRTALANTALESSVRQVRITPKTETTCPQMPTVGFGYPCDFSDGAPPSAVIETTQADVFARRFRLPVVQRGDLSVEHALGRAASFRVGYAGAIATQLPSTTDINIAPSTGMTKYQIEGGEGWRGLMPGETFAVPLYTQRLLAQYGPVTAIRSSANATYHAANAEFRANWKRVTMRASYTFSHAIDYGPQLSANPATMTQFDPFVNGYDKGRSSLDFTHHFAGVLVADTGAVRHGSSTMRRLASDWMVSAIGLAGSGAPYSYQIFGGMYLSGGRETINGAGGATYLPTVGRNTLRLPPRGSMDLRVQRGLWFRRGWHLEGFAEAFNLLNERSLTRVETRAFLLGTPTSTGAPTPLTFQDAAAIATEGLTTPAFGTATSSTSGLTRERQLEIGLRMRF
jgi:hypothetical protein